MVILIGFSISLIVFGVGLGMVQAIKNPPSKTEAQAAPGTVLVRTYQRAQDFERDANRLAAKGWSIQTQSSRTKKFGAATGVLTNKGVMTVTYIRG